MGYEALLRLYRVEVLPHFVRSFLGSQHKHLTDVHGQERREYPAQYRPRHPSPLIGHLEFALKYEGVHLGFLKQVFERAGTEQVAAYARQRPTGKYARRLWFLAEWLLGQELDVPDLKRGNYIFLLDDDTYFTSPHPRKSTRHRVHDNLLGTRDLCPFVRRTPALLKWGEADLAGKARKVVDGFEPALLSRAAEYLFTKETKASFAIERETPDQSRAGRFVEILREPAGGSRLSKARLVELQNAIVDPRYAEEDYRREQNYVGQSLPGRELIHFVCPKPEDVESLMRGFFAVVDRVMREGLDPVVAAAAVAFAFVYVHPFSDGNGRLHRYLIHHVLSASGFTPADTVLPVSATILEDRPGYDVCLERISRPLAGRLNYTLDAEGFMTVRGDTADLYRYLDLTAAAEYLYATLDRTVKKDFPEELEFLQKYDAVREEIRRVVDLPDQKLNLFVKLTAANHGKLNSGKRKRHFAELNDAEIESMEQAVREVFFEMGEDPSTAS